MMYPVSWGLTAGLLQPPSGAIIVTVDRADISDAPGLRALIGRLDELSALSDDWDSYGGLPPTARSIGAASRLIVEATTHAGETPSAVMPFPNGGLQVIWERGQDELQVDVGRDGGLGYLAIHRGSSEPELTESDSISLADVLVLVEHLPR
jgi:hypothetical protein